MDPLPQSILDSVERAQGTSPLLWLAEIEIERGTVSLPPTLLRICDGAEQLTWPAADPDPKTWDPFPFTFSPVQQQQDGSLTQLDLTVDNTTRVLMRWLHAAGGLEGNRCSLFLVARSGLAIAHPNHEFRRFDLQIATTVATSSAVTFRLALPNFFSFSSPADRYVPRRCRWQFGGPECGYVLNQFAAFASCPKTLTACILRGEDHFARGLPVVHPANYGGHPGTSRIR